MSSPSHHDVGEVDRLFLSFANKALKHWRLCADTEGVELHRHFGQRYDDTGMVDVMWQVPDYEQLIANHLGDLSTFIEADRLIKTLLQRGLLTPPNLLTSSGTPISSPEYEQMKPELLSKIIDPISEVVYAIRKLDPTDEELLTAFADYQKSWSTKNAQWQIFIPLLNFESDVPTLQLGRYELCQFTSSTKNMIAGGYFPPRLSPWDVAQSTFMLSLSYSHDDPGDYDARQRERDAAERVISALRLAGTGPLGALCYYQKDLVNKPYSNTTYSEMRDYGVKNSSQKYRLAKDRVAVVLSLISALDSMAESKRTRALEVALRRFNQSYGRSCPEDQIIDHVIALESCLLPDTKDELKLRFALRGTSLLARLRDPINTRTLLEAMYDTRSQIVHAGKLLADIRIKGLDHLQLKPTELPNSSQQILREVLIELLPHIESGETLTSISKELENKLIIGLSRIQTPPAGA
jgi:hypothetical protein